MGKYFELFVTVSNMLVLVNLVIGIMSDTYAHYVQYRKSLFSKNIIEAIPSYKNDKHYGSIISAFPPFNLISLIFLPILLCIKNKRKLKTFNVMACKLIYLPILLVTSVIFFVSSILMIPFAYFKMVTFKFKLYRKSTEQLCSKFFLYIVIGLPLLLIGSFTDLYWFIKHSLTWNLQLH